MTLSFLWRASAAFSLASIASTIPAAAQQGGGPPRNVGPWLFGFQGGVVHQFDSDLGSKGGFSSTRWFLQPSVAYAWDRQTSVGISFGYGETDYDFSGGATLGGAEPWDRIRDMRISAPIRFGVGDDISAIVIPSVRWNTESGADLDDGRTEGVLAGAFYKFSDSFSIGPGFGVFSEIDGGTNFFPIVLLNWDITDKVNLGTGGGLAATQGPGLTLTYKATDTLSLGFGGRIERQKFKLDDDGPAPNGIGQEESFPLFVTANWRPIPFGSVNLLAGVDLDGRLRLRDSGGSTITKKSYDPAPFLGLTFNLRF